ncbi:hypothetical protein NG791_15740 [Laspinema sp. D1]|uniref:hypothetical protein n=1 Tax=Laspinema palackyanum TaxID=3231601 RepID=UPI00349220C3|nr:hypothetical protein [Laspinema sp. D2b]
MDQDNKVQEPIFDVDSIEAVDSSPAAYRMNQQNRVNRRSLAVDRFTRYCFIYDPLVNLKTGRAKTFVLNPNMASTYFEDENDEYESRTVWNNVINIPSLKRLKAQYIEARNYSDNKYLDKAHQEITYYSCLAPCRIVNPREMTERYLSDYAGSHNSSKIMGSQDKQNTDNDSEDKSDQRKLRRTNFIKERIADKFETSDILYYKQYICCEYEGEKGWMILPRSAPLSFYDITTKIIGLGETIVEAELNFQTKRANRFLENMELTQNILDSNVPASIQEMKEICISYDKNIKLDSFKQEGIGSCQFKKARFKLSCHSEEYKFTVSVSPSSIRWTVETYIKSSVRVPIEATGKTLKEAFEKVTKQSNKISSNPELLRKEINFINEEIDQLQIQKSYDDYQGLIDEFGTDIFPD